MSRASEILRQNSFATPQHEDDAQPPRRGSGSMSGAKRAAVSRGKKPAPKRAARGAAAAGDHGDDDEDAEEDGVGVGSSEDDDPTYTPVLVGGSVARRGGKSRDTKLESATKRFMAANTKHNSAIAFLVAKTSSYEEKKRFLAETLNFDVSKDTFAHLINGRERHRAAAAAASAAAEGEIGNIVAAESTSETISRINAFSSYIKSYGERLLAAAPAAAAKTALSEAREEKERHEGAADKFEAEVLADPRAL